MTVNFEVLHAKSVWPGGRHDPGFVAGRGVVGPVVDDPQDHFGRQRARGVIYTTGRGRGSAAVRAGGWCGAAFPGQV